MINLCGVKLGDFFYRRLEGTLRVFFRLFSRNIILLLTSLFIITPFSLFIGIQDIPVAAFFYFWFPFISSFLGVLAVMAALIELVRNLKREKNAKEIEIEKPGSLKGEELYKKVLEYYLLTVGGGVQRFEMEISKLEKTGLNREQAIHRIAEQLEM